MDKIDAIVIHCSATAEGNNYKAADIDRWHREKGYNMIGYHYVIDLDGSVEIGRPLSMAGAHCIDKGLSKTSYNSHSVGICYIGGLDYNGKPKDTRTDAQKESMRTLVERLCEKYPIKEVIGHRDASIDKNKDGEVTKDEWMKDCPCFEVKAEFPMAICIATAKSK